MFLPMATPQQTAPSATEMLDSPEAGARMIRGGIVRLIAFCLSLLASLVSAPLVIRHLGPADYGYFATVTGERSWYQLCACLNPFTRPASARGPTSCSTYRKSASLTKR